MAEFTPFDPYSPFQQSGGTGWKTQGSWQTQGSLDSGHVGETRRDDNFQMRDKNKENEQQKADAEFNKLVEAVAARIVLTIAGGAGISVSGSGKTFTINLDKDTLVQAVKNSISATISHNLSGTCSGTNITISGGISLEFN